MMNPSTQADCDPTEIKGMKGGAISFYNIKWKMMMLVREENWKINRPKNGCNVAFGTRSMERVSSYFPGIQQF